MKKVFTHNLFLAGAFTGLASNTGNGNNPCFEVYYSCGGGTSHCPWEDQTMDEIKKT